MSASANRLEVLNLLPSVPTPADLEQRKLDRLLELRAVIETLRSEPASEDPVLAWFIEQENTQNP